LYFFLYNNRVKDINKSARVFIFFVFSLLPLSIVYLVFTKQAYFPLSLGIYKNFVLPLIFIFILVISDRFPIVYPSTKTNRVEVTLSFALSFAVAFLFTPFIAVTISFIASTVDDFFLHKPWFKTLFNGSMTSFTVGITSLLLQKFFIASLSFTSLHNMLVILSGTLLYFMVESSIMFALLSKINEKPFFSFWIENTEQVFIETLSLFPLGVTVIYFFLKNPIMNLFIIPTFFVVYFALKRRVQIIEETENTLFALADAVDARIPDTINHTRRVAKLSENLCSKLKLSTNLTNEIAIASGLHDIGKISIPDAILNKNGKLTEEEYEIIKKHSEEGEKIASELSLFKEGAKLIRHHHERYDGKGYPNGLKGEQIPFGARVINIADSFDTMITPRIYRSYTKSMQEALEEVERCKGTQFDPQIADAFIEMVKSDLERYYELIKLGKVTENN